MKLSSALYFAALSAVVYSHFTLDFPPTRGFDEDEEPKPVCGGFDDVGDRFVFPLKEGKIQITATHKATVFAEISFNSNPTNFTQFNTTSSGASYPKLIDFNQVEAEKVCFNVDISSLNVPDAKNGTNATLLVFYDGGDSPLYQCADLVLSDTVKIPEDAIASGLNCKTIKASSTTTTTGSGTATAPASTKTGSNGALSLTANSVAAGAIALLAIAAAF